MIMSKIIGRVFPTAAPKPAAVEKPASVEKPAADKKKPVRKTDKA